MTSTSHYTNMLASYSGRLCKHLQKGGSVDDHTGQLITSNIITQINSDREILDLFKEHGITGDMVVRYLSDSPAKLKDVLVVRRHDSEVLLTVWILIKEILSATLLFLKFPDNATEAEKEEYFVEHMVDSARSYANNQNEYEIHPLKVSGRGGISRSEASGCAAFPIIVIGILALIGFVIYKLVS